MSPSICGVRLSSVGVVAVLLYILDTTHAQDEQGFVQNEDYPVYNEVPKGLIFTCDDKIPGYYADPQTNCQVWHWCVPSIGGNLQYSFVCAPGTVFNQRTRVCDWDYKTDCPNSQAYYGINEDLYKDDTGNFINGKKTESYTNSYAKRRWAARRKRHDYVMQNMQMRMKRH